MSVFATHNGYAAHRRKIALRAGFTLVEMAIVLVIIGLLAGGVLVGQSLIEQTRIQKTVSEINTFKSAVNTFQIKYSGLPGDLKNATTFFTDVSNGDGNWQIQWWNEGLYAWSELAQAGFIPGSYSGAGDPTPDVSVPSSAYNDICGYSFAWEVKVAWQNNFNITGNVLHIGRQTAGNTTKTPCFSPLVAQTIDSKLDDGMPATGSVHSWDVNFTPDCITASAPDAEYDLSHENVACALLFQL